MVWRSYFVGKFLLFLNSFQKTLKTKQKDVFSAGLRMVVQVVPIFNTRDPLCGGQKGNQNILGLISCHRTGRPYLYRGVASGMCCPSLCLQPALWGRQLLNGARQQETFWLIDIRPNCQCRELCPSLLQCANTGSLKEKYCRFTSGFLNSFCWF